MFTPEIAFLSGVVTNKGIIPLLQKGYTQLTKETFFDKLGKLLVDSIYKSIDTHIRYPSSDKESAKKLKDEIKSREAQLKIAFENYYTDPQFLPSLTNNEEYRRKLAAYIITEFNIEKEENSNLTVTLSECLKHYQNSLTETLNDSEKINIIFSEVGRIHTKVIENNKALGKQGEVLNKNQEMLIASKELQIEDSGKLDSLVNAIIATNDKNEKIEYIEHGVTKNESNEFKISIAPTSFFSNRVGGAFPGTRGIQWFEGDRAKHRLSTLLKNPLKFHDFSGEGIHSCPIWWFRASKASAIEKFTILPNGKCLINYKELIISKIAVYVSDSYFKHMVYVEVNPDSQIGVYDNLTEEDIKCEVIQHGYSHQEFGLFNRIPITRTEYDDCATEIDGEIVNTFGAELRRRFLSHYNFIIVPKLSPYNCIEGNLLGEKFMNAILRREKTFEEFIEEFEKLPKHRRDF